MQNVRGGRTAVVGVGIGLLLVAMAACSPAKKAPPRAAALPPAAPVATPITMAALHQAGGVPPGWRFAPGAGDTKLGRQAFADFGCDSCHTVGGEPPATAPNEERRLGPDLSGMGCHHPAEYFVESILNPDAVLIDGRGYIGADGHSIMPTYPTMTLAQLGDIVAYLKSLDGGTPCAGPAAATTGPATDVRAKPISFVVQIHEVTADAYDQIEDWFQQDETRRRVGSDGLVTVDTYVNRSAKGRMLVTLYGFDNDFAARRFMAEGLPFDQSAGKRSLLHPGSRALFRNGPIYRALSLSAP